VQEEVLEKTEGKENHIDIVLYCNNYPHVEMEVKSLSFGKILDESDCNNKESVLYLVTDLQRKSTSLGSKYAVLTRFAETVIFDTKTMDKIAIFSSPRMRFERFHIYCGSSSPKWQRPDIKQKIGILSSSEDWLLVTPFNKISLFEVNWIIHGINDI